MGLQEIFEKIKSGALISFDFSNLKKILDKSPVKFFSDNKVEIHHHHYDQSTRTYFINTAALKSEEKGQLAELLQTKIDDDCPLLEDNVERRIEDIQEEEKSPENAQVLEFFRDKVTPQDMNIIRGAFYIRRCHLRGEKIEGLKGNIVERYGDRGRNIVNLCSAGYFEKYLIPYYELIFPTKESKKEAIEEFSKIFNIIVNELPFTIFVWGGMSEEEVLGAIRGKVEASVAYGVKFINIHGMKANNIEKIRKAIDNPELKSIKNFKKDIQETDKSIYVRLTFEV